MLAICRFNRGNAIPIAERYFGEMDQTDYSPLIIGNSYVVYALLFIFERIDFLVRAPEQPPFWAPGSLFELVDATIPSGWKFCVTQTHPNYRKLFNSFKINYIMGYSLLINEYQHYVGLVEREPREIQRFFEENLE